jgi:hypothetical protein
MARTRTGAELIDDSYKRADLEGATDRFPRTEVLRYVNQGGAALYDILIEARGRAFFAVKPAVTITTLASTSRYAFGSGSVAANFYRLSAARVGGAGGYMLSPFTPQDEPSLREPGVTADKPTHYEIQPGYIELLPLHSAGVSVVVDYVPHFTDLTDGSTTFDGINGWEEYIPHFAASCMLTKDDELALKNSCLADMAALERRIGKLATKRDAFRAERVKNVRGGGLWRGRFY